MVPQFKKLYCRSKFSFKEVIKWHLFVVALIVFFGFFYIFKYFYSNYALPL